ncbi:MAG: LacI family transcriptional regulator, repressor for deo operon, udp, cdd, tsx, nupC, and nupG [Clostridiales bacterium]|jgi:DNA-binding LacI/PurR family transcriptional regulator|nr:LacI family transcriptional regulator, repressor for deo operon, udp, cdd, tsx, nupC, and nupG [Clostridiales bacterium]MDK2934599.1 LacI family transcriptional regulator, repressor for deo operon, udp, cdd, tsx, nupC, and nupG [Clostridiales bacterium]
MPTIEEVAKAAGVSVATVSRVLNNGQVSPKTRILVENAIRELNYEPNMLGRNLRRSESRMILTMIPNISNPFYSVIVEGIEDAARKNGYNILLCNTEADVEREKIYLDLLKQKLADGIITMEPAIDIDVLKEVGKRYPVVQCCEYSEKINIPYIAIDNVTAAYKATKHLLTIGHKKIALINSDEKFMYARQRKEGYIKALQEFDIPVNEDWIVNAGLSFESGQRMMKYLLSLKDKPSAVFAVSDILAIGALKTIKDEGLKVPQDIGVVGFDNIQFANMMNPTLTTIEQPRYQMGVEAAEMLIKRIKDKKQKVENVILDHQLIIRESTMEY